MAKVGEQKSYDSIEEFANANDYTIKEMGPEYVGENFIVLTHNEKDIVESYVLTSANGKGYFYTCVYSDNK